jgi:hypothetical protein
MYGWRAQPRDNSTVIRLLCMKVNHMDGVPIDECTREEWKVSNGKE